MVADTEFRLLSPHIIYPESIEHNEIQFPIVSLFLFLKYARWASSTDMPMFHTYR